MMEKANARDYQPQDFKLIEDTILNMESMIPQNQKRSKSSGRTKSHRRVKTISQKHVLDALDQTLYHSKVHQHLEFKNTTHIRRMLLKTHSLLTRVKQAMSLTQQVELLLKFFNYEMSKIETSLIADQTYFTCLK